MIATLPSMFMPVPFCVVSSGPILPYAAPSGATGGGASAANLGCASFALPGEAVRLPGITEQSKCVLPGVAA
jgi:hypothetical protein